MATRDSSVRCVISAMLPGNMVDGTGKTGPPNAGELQQGGWDHGRWKRTFRDSEEMRSMAEASFEQARKAFESFIGSAQQTAETFGGKGDAARASAKDISAKAIAFAEKNVQASLAYAQSADPRQGSD